MAQSPIPKSPIPNPQSPIPKKYFISSLKIINKFIIIINLFKKIKLKKYIQFLKNG